MKKILYLSFVFMTCSLSAHIYKPSNEDHLFDALARKDLAIVMFYHDLKNDKRMHSVKDSFKAASRNEPYVTFIYANVDKDDILQTAQNLGAQTFPTFMLFKRSKGIVQKLGYLAKYDIIDFIEKHFGKDIDKILKFKRQQAERRAEQARINAAYWWPYWGFGWGYPGYGYGYWGAPYYGYYGGRW